MYKILLSVILLTRCITTSAAEISVERFRNTETYFVVISGEIKLVDGDKFQSLVRGIHQAIVILDSPGGSVMSGLEIGRAIKLNNFSTAVPNETLCASSCALIWLAGNQRFAEENSFVGFHAAYVYKNGKPVESGVGNALVGSYLNGLGLSDNAIIYVTNAPPEGIERLTRSTAEQVGIKYTSINTRNIPIKEKQGFGIKSGGYNPVETVTKFYRALSLADGNAASAFVIPEKRGIGPFNEKNISSFFGKMNTPLKVNEIRLIDKDTVEVNYTYRYTNSECKAKAIVKTGYFLGNTLIKKIKANC